MGQVSVIIKVISHELGIILDDDAQLFGTGDEIPDLLAGLAQGLSLIHISWAKKAGQMNRSLKPTRRRSSPCM